MTRKPDDWMPLHIGEYQADTAHLTRDQHGAYLLLLMAYWRRGGPLPAHDGRLAAIAKATAPEWRKLRPILAEFFVERDGHWHQKRADAELQKAVALTNAKSKGGKAGADKRWHKDGSPTGTPIGQPSSSHRQNDAPLPSPVPRKEKIDSQGEFDSFFAVFPKQEQRDNAEREFVKALAAGATAAELQDGARRFAAHVEREKIPLRFVALAKTWLVDGCWKDRYGEPEQEAVLPPLDPSWPAEEVRRWTKNLGEVNFRTYFGPAQFIDCEPRILRYRSTTLRGLAESHYPQVAREVALEVAA